jgi:diguanylate cyclase (GGDEF)-like protein
VVILPNTEKEGALHLAEQMRAEVQALNMPHKNSPVCPEVTVSLGVSSVVPIPGYGPEQLLARADHGLYQAKEAGRNRVQYTPFLANAPTES